MRKRYVSFTLGTGRYCIPVDQVVQILRPENILEVPKAPPFVDGVINLRGDVIPIVNLRARLGIRREAITEAPPSAAAGAKPAAGAKLPAGATAAAGANPATGPRARIVVTRAGARSCGLAVDEVREIVDIDDAGLQTEAAEAFGEHADFVLGVAHRESSMYLILDLARVLSAGRDHAGAG